ncbi:hypothetical protein [Anaeromyxobacter diazotrophicus]|uniref:Uncharacterized protein n=1 Tax=Anaeromyxobacter diazotrophicus TaxID=2590199 RepID=A0A7I9VPJ8_9BACT|nr:hypothetical protein [Anaeromyxobacter diazotrophicus]GEJ58040.1 hypothetical protein AMYX_27810 [Anaeromyxobacter diazotrophicus]
MATEALTRGAWPRVQWGPVIAGVLCAIACHIVLGLFGAAFGFAAGPADSKGIGIGAGIWGLLTPFAASLAGAWVAVRIAAEREEAGAVLHGAMVWAIGLIAGAIFLTGVLSSGAMTLGTAASGNVGARAVERRDTPGNRARAQATAEDAAKGAAAGSGAAGVAALLGLAGAVLGATIGRRMVTGEGMRPRHGLPARASTERTVESGVAYTTREGYVATRPPGEVDRLHDEGLDPRH